jgi:hypothetical protein
MADEHIKPAAGIDKDDSVIVTDHGSGNKLTVRIIKEVRVSQIRLMQAMQGNKRRDEQSLHS